MSLTLLYVSLATLATACSSPATFSLQYQQLSATASARSLTTPPTSVLRKVL